MRVLQQRLRRGDLFVDARANVGTYPGLAAALGASVIAVEAAADTAIHLWENVAQDGSISGEVVEAAAGSALGSTPYNVDRDSVNRIDVEGSVGVRVAAPDSLTGSRRVAGLKVDVEGQERELLEGASSALRDRRIALVQMERNSASPESLEQHRDPVADMLNEYGYRLLRPSRDGVLLPTDDLERPSEMFVAPASALS
ncbi:FkbM family methyltransferase [Acidiferrimicrobium sp. IK]|uniref:FkbM family methyltransferase n=1 Tax=Acidiferrimicrobium sp. IK TaxID=2871700 RepID=UPI0021CAEA31|nr:FkbM family methyltransferase [Acidiferrimicrobium sp. IK]MCU4187149.1 FkbM family methyltransferase [Acidiferrimicrobium sp. IK]